MHSLPEAVVGTDRGKAGDQALHAPHEHPELHLGTRPGVSSSAADSGGGEGEDQGWSQSRTDLGLLACRRSHHGSPHP